MAKKLKELVREAIAKGETEEGRRELREQRERMNAEAARMALAFQELSGTPSCSA